MRKKLKIRSRYDCPLSPFLSTIILEVLARAMDKRSKYNGYKQKRKKLQDCMERYDSTHKSLNIHQNSLGKDKHSQRRGS